MSHINSWDVMVRKTKKNYTVDQIVLIIGPTDLLELTLIHTSRKYNIWSHPHISDRPRVARMDVRDHSVFSGLCAVFGGLLPTRFVGWPILYATLASAEIHKSMTRPTPPCAAFLREKKWICSIFETNKTKN